MNTKLCLIASNIFKYEVWVSWCNLGMRHNIAMFGIIIPEGTRTNRLIKVDKHLK